MSNDQLQSIMALVDDYSDASHDYEQACALDLTGEMKKASARCRELEDQLRAAIREAIAAPGVAQGWQPASGMTAERAAYFMRRFKHEEKLLGPNEQAAVDFVLDMLEPSPTTEQPDEPRARDA